MSKKLTPRSRQSSIDARGGGVVDLSAEGHRAEARAGDGEVGVGQRSSFH